VNTPRFFSKSALTDEHLRAIGLIAAEWSVLEITLEAVLMHFFADDWERGRILTVEMSNTARINAILSLAQLERDSVQPMPFELHRITADQFEQLRMLCSKFDSLRSQRNSVIHAYWTDPETREEGAKYLRVTARRQLKVSTNSFSALQLDALAAEIAQLRNEIHEFMFMELESGYFV
jgi:hypothetical protein